MKLFKIDSEVAGFGEWDYVEIDEPSTMEQAADPTSPGLGGTVLRVRTVAFGYVNVEKDSVHAMAPGEAIYLGFWMRVAAPPAATAVMASVYGSTPVARLRLLPSGAVQMQYVSSTNSLVAAGAVGITAGWCYLVMGMRRASASGVADGWARLYVNGGLMSEATGLNNFSTLNINPSLAFGAPIGQENLDIYYDDVTMTVDEYPEPYAPAPLGEYPEPRRTVVLYRAASADSYAFADYCATHLGIPRANLCPLPHASATELLAGYAAFQTEVETDLAAWLAIHPTIASRVTTFLVGYGVPGGFTVTGVAHSATSRLMRLGAAFSSQTPNPLYAPQTVQRLSVSTLRAAGAYLACRIDAAGLAAAQAIVDAGDSPIAIDAGQTLYSDDAAYRASLPCQHLRLQAAAMGTFAGDAFIFGAPASPVFAAAGARACYVDGGTSSAYSLRGINVNCHNALAAGYAATLGMLDASDTLSASSFFEMLRIGGSLPEAAAVAAAHVDSALVVVGSPTLSCTFPLGGYNVYHGAGGADAIDWASPVAYARAGAAAVSVPLSMAPGEWHVLAARAVSAAGVEEGNSLAIAYAAVDSEGRLLSPILPAATDVTAELLPDGSISVGFSYDPAPGAASPEAFDILSDRPAGVMDMDHPAATVATEGRTGDFQAIIPPGALPVRLAVRGRSGGAAGLSSDPVTVRPATLPPLSGIA